MLRLTSLAPDIIEAILRGDLSRRSAAKTDEPDGFVRYCSSTSSSVATFGRPSELPPWPVRCRARRGADRVSIPAKASFLTSARA
jgi:hypothetical protein